MSSLSAHSFVKKNVKRSPYLLRSTKLRKHREHTYPTYCTRKAFCKYTLCSRKRSCSCQFCAPEASVCSNSPIFIQPEKMSTGDGSGSSRRRQRATPYTRRLSWEPHIEYELIELCYAEWKNVGHLGKGFTDNTLAKIGQSLNETFRPGENIYTLEKVKSKIKNYKKAYQLHERCLGYSGYAWNEQNETLSISDDCYAAIIASDPYNEQILKKGCPNFKKYQEMWANSSATGEAAISSGGDMSSDPSGPAVASTARTTRPLGFVHARARGYAGESSSRQPTTTDERVAHMQGYEQFQKFMAERPRPADKVDAIQACIDEVEAMDCTEMQKMLGGVALGDDNFWAIFIRWSPERKLMWLRNLGQ